MKKQKILRILSLAMLTVLLTGALAGCGEQEPKEELSAGQIAEMLELKEDNVESRIRRGLKKLQKSLSEQGVTLEC